MIKILMPKLGLTMKEGLIVEWKKGEGDTVKKGDILFVLETEKVTYEVEAPEDGVLSKILVKEGKTVIAGTEVAFMLKPGDNANNMVQAEQAVSVNESIPSAGRLKATPLAKKIAIKYGIDLASVVGTGSGGRILKDDVEKARLDIDQKFAAQKDVISISEIKILPITGMRRMIAKKMLQSKIESAQTYMSNNVDAFRLLEYREILLPFVEKKYGVRLTITDIIMKITAAALCEHPIINTQWTEDGILYHPDVHMGMAMALNEGLIVPVIKNINHKSLGQIAIDRTMFIKKGKTNTFLPDDIKGSTFTLSAMGMFGIEQFTAIINQPENAILAVAAIIDTPVAIKGEITIRPRMNVNLSYDHRTIDGAEAGRFMRTLKVFIEDPILILG